MPDRDQPGQSAFWTTRYAIAAEGCELCIDPAPPANLDAHLRVLHTGVRALVVGKPWFGSADARARRPWVEELAPDELLPRDVGLLCVSGDAEWDRLPEGTLNDNPELFAEEGEQKPKRKTRNNRAA